MAEKLRQWMGAQGLTRREFADALGISESLVALILSGHRQPSGGFRWRFAEKYGYGTARLVFEDQPDPCPDEGA